MSIGEQFNQWGVFCCTGALKKPFIATPTGKLLYQYDDDIGVTSASITPAKNCTTMDP